ncbi:hypothetical protein QR680_017240 [Steinernema hermaphroditum]|uniref:Uncharacterized protein n=1 Tax=Steinernema hermaphroditum TaxID=289476 RepID=A0AA39LNN7_9BILA|nr:hypothetical protein QR680_017240 [Steinernema hermaphroditum]
MSPNDCQIPSRKVIWNTVIVLSFLLVFVEALVPGNSSTGNLTGHRTIVAIAIAVPVTLIVLCFMVFGICCFCCSKGKGDDTTTDTDQNGVDEAGPLMESSVISTETLEMLRKAAPPPEERGKRKPFKLKAEMFKYKGPLQIRIFTNPPKRHALQNAKEVLNFTGDLIFDDSLNEVYEIGWDVEEVKYVYDKRVPNLAMKKARSLENLRKLPSQSSDAKLKTMAGLQSSRAEGQDTSRSHVDKSSTGQLRRTW